MALYLFCETDAFENVGFSSEIEKISFPTAFVTDSEKHGLGLVAEETKNALRKKTTAVSPSYTIRRIEDILTDPDGKFAYVVFLSYRFNCSVDVGDDRIAASGDKLSILRESDVPLPDAEGVKRWDGYSFSGEYEGEQNASQEDVGFVLVDRSTSGCGMEIERKICVPVEFISRARVE